MLAAELGFDGLGTNEHHQNPYGFMCNPNLFGSILARLTRDTRHDDVALVQLGATLAATSPPIRIAEEYAVLDCISGGRLVAGLPLGLGCDADDELRRPADRAARALARGDRPHAARPGPIHEFFAWNGKHYQLPQVNLWPRPVQTRTRRCSCPGRAASSTWDYCHERDWPYAFLSYFGGKSAESAMDGFWAARRGQRPRPQPVPRRVPAARRRRRHRRAGRGAVRRARRVLLQEAPALPAAVPRAARLQRLQEPARRPSRQGFLAFADLSVDLKPLSAKDMIEREFVVVGSPATVRERLADDGEAPDVGHLMAVLQFGSMPHEMARRTSSSFGVATSCRTCRTLWDARGLGAPLVAEAGATPVRDVRRGS